MTSARLLIGTAFLMAVIWKGVLSPDYLDGRFFRVTWLTDERFEDAVQLLGQLSPPQLEHNRVALQPSPREPSLLHQPTLDEPLAFRSLVLASTWGILIMEAWSRRVPDSVRQAGVLLTTRASSVLLRDHVRDCTGRGIRLAVADDGRRAVPVGSASAPRGVCRHVVPGPPLLGGPVGASAGGMAHAIV